MKRVQRPGHRKARKMICTTDKRLWLPIKVERRVRTLGLQLVPLPPPILLIYTVHFVLVPHFFCTQIFHLTMFHGKLYKHRLGKVFHFLIPNITHLIRAKSLRRRCNWYFHDSRYKLQLFLRILNHKIVFVLFATLTRVHNCRQHILPRNQYWVRRYLYC